MDIEALVLERHEHGEVALVDLVGLERQPPAAFVRRERAQEPVAAVEHGDRDRVCLGEIGRAQPRDGHVKRRHSDGENERRRTEAGREPA